MERRIKEEVPGVGVEFPSYVDDLHCGLYDGGRAVRVGSVMDRKERMEDLLGRVSVVLKEVAAERGLPLAEDKEERLVLRCRSGRRGRRGVAEKVKWLGVILDEDLDFGQHWEYRIGKARSLLGALDGVGSSKWGMSPLSWRQAYTGMVRSVASWGIEVVWRGQREWHEMMEKLQYAALRKCTGAVVGARKEYVRKMAAVEGVETFACAAAGRFLARTMCDPIRAGVAEVVDTVMAGAGELSLGGRCWRGAVELVDLGVGAGGSSRDWEGAIAGVSGGCIVPFTDGSRDVAGRVAGGWCDSRGGEGCELVGSVATVWDGEVAGMRLALESLPKVPLLVLSDWRAALAAVRSAASAGVARTADLRRVVDQVGEWALEGVPLRFCWVKAHVWVLGNERADALAKAGCAGGGPARATEGGVRALWKRLRAGDRSVPGLGAGRVSGWGRRAVSRYAQLRTGKGDLVAWQTRLRRGEGFCRLCDGEVVETGSHLVFRCPGTRGGVRWEWSPWIELDDKSRWAYEYEEGGKVKVGDRVEDFFAWLDRELCGVG